MQNRILTIVGSIIAIILSIGFSLWLTALHSGIKKNNDTLSTMGADVAVIRSKIADADDVNKRLMEVTVRLTALEATYKLHVSDPSIHHAGMAKLRDEIRMLRNEIDRLKNNKP